MVQKIYEWHDKMKFGKYEGIHLDEAFQTDPEYIQECLENMDDFHITVYTRKYLEDLIVGFSFSEKALKSVVNQKKYSSQDGESEFKLYPSGDPFIQPLDDIGFDL
jgi:hypothetical protein